MTSPSELMEAMAVALPVTPLRIAFAESNVSRLSFPPLEQMPAEIVVSKETDESCSSPDEEIYALNLRLQEQMQQASVQLEKAHRDAREEARGEWEEELEKKIAAERESVRRICEQFEEQRTRYFADVEEEVVRLALGIAARILHREVKLDPLLLTAAVRVALEKVEEGSSTVLRVPEGQVELWRDVFAGRSTIQVSGDKLLSAGEGVLETNAGTVELGVNAQLSEIERGFFDLMQRRPA